MKTNVCWMGAVRRVLLAMACLALCHTALAAGSCSASPGMPITPAAANMAVATNLPVGSTIPGSVHAYSISGTCVASGNALIVASAPIISCYYGSGSETGPGSGIYTTGVTGVGIRLRNAAGQPLANAAGGSCNTVGTPLGTLDSSLKYAITFTIEFVKTGPIISGTLVRGQTNFGLGVYNSGVGIGSNTGNNYVGLSGAITPRQITCTVNAPTTVMLPSVSANTLANSPNAGATAFQIQLTCGGNAVVGLTLDGGAGTPVQSASSGVLGTSNAGSGGAASGVGVQIMNASGSAAVPLQVRNAMGNITANIQATYPFLARYTRLAGPLAAGTISSAMVFTLDYQ